MDNLDNKLRKLLAPLYVPEDFDDAQLIAQIKQALAEAGYIKQDVYEREVKHGN
jgi:hypothetical protein